MIFVKNSRLARIIKVKGIVLYPFVFFADKDPDNVIVKHELVHVDQIRCLGTLRFYYQYISEYIKLRKSGLSHDLAYRSISFEVEAYDDNKKIS